MSFNVKFTDDPSSVLAMAGEFLAADPVRNSVMLRLLSGRVLRPVPGRYWITQTDGPDIGAEVCGVVFQSPLSFPVLVTAMSAEAIHAVVDSMAGTDVAIPGVGSNAETAAAFAGLWAERTKSAARPTTAGRQYECAELIPPLNRAAGELRIARPDERDLMVEWFRAFKGDTPTLPVDVEAWVDLALAEDRLWVWDDDGAVSMAISSLPIEGVMQINAVYTPPEKRAHGYASACVATLTERVLSDGYRCSLYTVLSNPTSNSIYQRIGYRAVQETLNYEFGPAASAPR